MATQRALNALNLKNGYVTPDATKPATTAKPDTTKGYIPGIPRRRRLRETVGFWVFDYPAESELQVKEHVHFIANALATRHSDIKFEHINLSQPLSVISSSGNSWTSLLNCKKDKGNDALMRALAGPLAMKRLAPSLLIRMKQQIRI